MKDLDSTIYVLSIYVHTHMYEYVCVGVRVWVYVRVRPCLRVCVSVCAALDLNPIYSTEYDSMQHSGRQDTPPKAACAASPTAAEFPPKRELVSRVTCSATLSRQVRSGNATWRRHEAKAVSCHVISCFFTLSLSLARFGTLT